VAALRGMVNSAEKGVVPAGITIQARPTRRNIREAVGAEAVRQALELTSAAIADDSSRVAEAELLCRRLVALARARGLIRSDSGGNDNTEKLRAIWGGMASDPVIADGTTHVLGLLGPHDTLIVLDRTLTADFEIDAAL